MSRAELAEKTIAICQHEIDTDYQDTSSLSGSIAWLAATATYLTLGEVFKNVTCQEVYAGNSYKSCHTAAWLTGKQSQWCAICQVKAELLDFSNDRTLMMKRLPDRAKREPHGT